MTQVSLDEIETTALKYLNAHGHAAIALRAAKDCAWLQAVGYAGLQILTEAVADTVQTADIEKDLMGLDLHHVSCVFLADKIGSLYTEHGRMFLRNVRHGLYLVPMSVHGNFGIGCPVDPGFALGGERTKNPYPEKLNLAMRDGIAIDDELWSTVKMGA
jgi:hypothetical protein